MNKFLGIIGVFIVFNCPSHAQENKKYPAAPLFNYPGSIASISWDGSKQVFPSEPRFSNLPQCLVKNRKGLYVILKGSGRLYKASLNDGSIAFERMDSTFYFGDNFDSFNFSYRDTLYSLGGYGFWETNGLLRYYVDMRHEWEIIKLNQKLPIKTGNTYDLIWYDQINGKLYFGFTTEENSTTTEKISQNKIHFETMVLDMKQKKWLQLGSLSPYLKNDLTNVKNIISSPFGQMIAFQNKNLFLDYANNRIYRLSDTKQREIEQLPSNTGDAHINYFIDSIFYSWLTVRNLVDSIKIGKEDLVLLDEKIYIPGQAPATADAIKTPSNPLPIILIMTGFIVAIFISYYVGKRKNNLPAFPSQLQNNYNTDNGGNIIIRFSPLEIDVIKTVFENSLKATYTSIEELNKALGVSKKNSDTQKKQRSDIISSINKKYFYVKQSNQELIEKRRTELDKRSFEYIIGPARLEDANVIIKTDIKG